MEQQGASQQVRYSVASTQHPFLLLPSCTHSSIPVTALPADMPTTWTVQVTKFPRMHLTLQGFAQNKCLPKVVLPLQSGVGMYVLHVSWVRDRVFELDCVCTQPYLSTNHAAEEARVHASVQ